MDIRKILSELTVEEKAALVAGVDFMYTNPVSRLGISSIRMSDGPHGLRVQSKGGDNGVAGSEPAICFPTAVTTASGWNPDNTYKMGVAIGEECSHYGINILLGPGTNIKRNPLGGRNFEYFSEDPLLAGKMAAAQVRGVQEKGVGVSVKHFALNNSENFRFMGDSVCDMRAIRELYLKPFEIIVNESKPETLMCAYNKINGTYCCQNRWLLIDVLRGEWGYDGLIMTDWGATHDRLEMLRAGLDLEMPGDTDICRRWIIDGVADGTLKNEDLDKAVENVLRIVEKHEHDKKREADFVAHNTLAAEIAADCAVLLKNDGVLPLVKEGSYLVVGELFEKPRYQGAGSSIINPMFLSTPQTAFEERKVNYQYAKGYKENQLLPDKQLIKEAVSLADGYEKVLVFAGLTDYVESEGTDREDMRLPENQLALIDGLVRTGKKVIVILYGGSPVELPFADKVQGILNMYLPGQNGGEAMAQLLFGDKTPCGKLAETWAERYEDVPFGKDFGKMQNEIYKESIFVGYRYYLTANKKVRYPFGYGLSYTSFDYRSMEMSETEAEVKVTCEVVNTGKYDGAEIVQLYVKAPQNGVFRPQKELKGFTKVYLKVGEGRQIIITVKKEDLRYWNVKENCWVLQSGEYGFELCSDCLTVRMSQSLALEGEEAENPYSDAVNRAYCGGGLQITSEIFQQMSGLKIPTPPPPKPIHMESRFTDMRQTFMGKILYNAVLSVAKKDMKEAEKLPEGTERDNKIKGAMFLKRILESNSIITMSMSAGMNCPYNFAQGFINLANGHIFKGLKCFCTKIRVPKLPKDREEN